MLSDIAVMVLVKDGEDHLRQLAPQLRLFGEVVIADDHSTDATASIARSFGWTVIQPPAGAGFDVKRDAGVRATTKPWVFMLDSDERIDSSFIKELETIIADPRYDAYACTMNVYFADQPLRFGGTSHGFWVTRLFRRSAYRGFVGQIHERLLVGGRQGKIATPVHHHTYLGTQHYLEKINVYTTHEAIELQSARITWLPPIASLWADLVATVAIALRSRNKVAARTFLKSRIKNKYVVIVAVPLYPVGRFLSVYVLRQGFRDGGAGLKYAALSACYSVVKYSKFFEMRRR